jgi:hypothetical protein
MTDEELDAWLAAADQDALATLQRHIDTEASLGRLHEELDRQPSTPTLKPDSPAGEPDERT